MPIRVASREVWVYILLENKSERSILVMFQVFLYIFHMLLSIWREWEQLGIADSKRRFPIIIPLVFYNGQQKWDGPLELSQCFVDIPELSHFIPGWQTLFLNLNTVTDEQLVEANSLASQVFRVIKTEGHSYEEYDAILSSVLKSVTEMPDVTDGNRLEANWLLLLQAYHTLPTSEAEKAHEKITESVMESTQKLREGIMGRENSYAAQLKREGETKGKEIGLRDALLMFIESRFGPPSEKIVERVYAVDLDTITDWIRRIVSANSLDELGILPLSK